MSNCDATIKINPLPECIELDAYNPYLMENLNFSDHDTNMIAKVRNNATTQVRYIQFTTDTDGDAQLDIYNMFPLMDHVYTIEFVNQATGDPETFTITNNDGTTSTGCSIEFGINVGQVDDNRYFYVSTQGCQV